MFRTSLYYLRDKNKDDRLKNYVQFIYVSSANRFISSSENS